MYRTVILLYWPHVSGFILCWPCGQYLYLFLLLLFCFTLLCWLINFLIIIIFRKPSQTIEFTIKNYNKIKSHIYCIRTCDLSIDFYVHRPTLLVYNRSLLRDANKILLIQFKTNATEYTISYRKFKTYCIHSCIAQSLTPKSEYVWKLR